MGHFSRSFVRVRMTMGFKTAYSFYHDNGGRRVFPFTYAYYLKVERGSSLPSVPWLAVLLDALRIGAPAPRAELTKDYLRDLAGDASAYDALFAPLIRCREESEDRRVLRRATSNSMYNVTPAQLGVLASSPETFGCMAILLQTAGALKRERIAELLGSTPEACARALKELCRAGLVKAAPGRRFSCRRPDMFHRMPTDSASRRLFAKLRRNLDVLALRQNRSFCDVSTTVRLDRAEIDATAADLRAVMERAAARGFIAPDGFDAPLCLVESRLLQIAGSRRR